MQYLPVVVHADPFDSNATSTNHSQVLTARQPRVLRASSSTQLLRIYVKSATHFISYWGVILPIAALVPGLNECDGYRVRVDSSQRDNSREFRNAVRNYEQNPVAFLCFRERSDDIDREAFERALGWEES